MLLGKGVELLGCDDLKLIAERAQSELKDVNNKITALRLKMGFLQEKVEQYRKLAKTLEQQKAVDKQAEAAAQSMRQQLAGAEGQLKELKKQLAEQNELLTDVDEQELQQEHESYWRSSVSWSCRISGSMPQLRIISGLSRRSAATKRAGQPAKLSTA